jgi:hypothetical protein
LASQKEYTPKYVTLVTEVVMNLNTPRLYTNSAMMESQQMIELLLAKLDENAKTSQEEMLAKILARMEAREKERKAEKEVREEERKAEREAREEERKAEREADREQRKADIGQILAKMEEIFAKMDMKANPGMMLSVGEHQEVIEEEAAVMPVGEPKKRRRNRNLAAERRQKPKERTRGYCGSRKRVTVADRKVSRRATVAQHRRNIFAQE